MKDAHIVVNGLIGVWVMNKYKRALLTCYGYLEKEMVEEPADMKSALDDLEVWVNKSIRRVPRFVKGQYSRRYDSYHCPTCGHILIDIPDYCKKCGQHIRWGSIACLTGDDIMKGKLKEYEYE